MYIVRGGFFTIFDGFKGSYRLWIMVIYYTFFGLGVFCFLVYSFRIIFGVFLIFVGMDVTYGEV